MLKVNVHHILKQHGMSLDFQYRDNLDMAEVDLSGPVSADFRITNAGSRLVTQGKIIATVEMECARCLETYPHKIETQVLEEFLPQNSPELTRKEDDLNWDDLSRFSYEGDIIDMYEVLRQNILANIPMKPLCRKDCPGIPREDEDS